MERRAKASPSILELTYFTRSNSPGVLANLKSETSLKMKKEWKFRFLSIKRLMYLVCVFAGETAAVFAFDSLVKQNKSTKLLNSPLQQILHFFTAPVHLLSVNQTEK